MNIGKILGGVAKTALGGLGGMVVDKVAGQLFGSKNKPSSAVKDALTPPANPYNVELVDSARNLGSQGRNLTALVTPDLNNAIQSRIKLLSGTEDIDRLTQMTMGEGVTGNEAAFQRAKANTEMSLKRRGVGGGIAAAARANLEGKRAAGQNAAMQSAEKFRIGATQQRKAELANWLTQLLDKGQSDTLRADNILFGLGNAEAQRQGIGQQNTASTLQQIAAEIARGSAGKRRTPSILSSGSGVLVGGDRPGLDLSSLATENYTFEPALTPLDRPAFNRRASSTPATFESLASSLDPEDVPALLRKPARKTSIWD